MEILLSSFAILTTLFPPFPHKEGYKLHGYDKLAGCSRNWLSLPPRKQLHIFPPVSFSEVTIGQFCSTNVVRKDTHHLQAWPREISHEQTSPFPLYVPLQKQGSTDWERKSHQRSCPLTRNIPRDLTWARNKLWKSYLTYLGLSFLMSKTHNHAW